jgi:hypothetical protein
MEKKENNKDIQEFLSYMKYSEIFFNNNLSLFYEHLLKNKKITEFYYNAGAQIKPFEMSLFKRKGLSLDKKA